MKCDRCGSSLDGSIKYKEEDEYLCSDCYELLLIDEDDEQ
jgi:hypothetical protein